MGKVIVLYFEDMNEEIIQNILALVGETYPVYDKLEPNLIMSFERMAINIPEKRTIAETVTPKRPCTPAAETWRLISRGTKKGEYEPQVVKKYQNTVT